MSRSLFVHLLPALTTPQQLHNQVAVVIDILRASTTILHALDAGVASLTPLSDIADARRVSLTLPRPVLLGGERGGTKIKGFDIDNSPLSYTPDACAGRHLVFTTTNGTRALATCLEAASVHIGAFSNLTATCSFLEQTTHDVHLVCAGTDGEITLEDVLFAGAVIQRLLAGTGDFTIGNDSARLALSLLPANLDQASVVDLFRVSSGGRNLLELGYDHDLERAAEIDRIPFVATWDRASNRIYRQ